MLPSFFSSSFFFYIFTIKKRWAYCGYSAHLKWLISITPRSNERTDVIISYISFSFCERIRNG